MSIAATLGEALRRLAALALLGIAATSAATEPSTLPQVRVLQDMHTAPIGQIRADARFERLVTESSDKTLRIWRLADLQPLRQVALPAEPGPEGSPNSVAISADGRRIYAAGHTGRQWRQASHVYVVDADSGRILGALGRFDDDVVTALDLSPDGRRLAVGLGRGGLVVLDAVSGARVFDDARYAAPVSFVHHAPDGRLASAAGDGCLRVYSAAGELVLRNQYPPTPTDRPQCTGGELGGVRFSPDGRWLALGTRSSAEVGLFDGRTLQWQRSLHATAPEQRSLCCVAWSPDSRTLYLDGSGAPGQPTPLYIVRDPAAGKLERWSAGRQQFTNMLPLPDGSIVLATSMPSLTRIGSDGRVARGADGRPLSAEPQNVDFFASHDRLDAFRVAADGSAVAFAAGPERWLLANPFTTDPDRVLSAPAAADRDRLRPALHTGALKVEAGTGELSYQEKTQVEGHPVALAYEEGVRSWAVHARLRLAALGTQWRIHLLDDRARPAAGWEEPPFLSAPALHTAISDDGRWVVVALSDGTVHWYEVASGRERLGLFVHANGSDWVAWRPDGYYASSPLGDRFIGWLVNRGFAQSPDVFRALQFERELYRPEAIQSALRDRPATEAGQRQLAATLAGLAAPRVAIESVQAAADGGTLTIRFSAEATGRAIREVGVYVGGLPLLAAADRTVAAGEAKNVSRTVVVPWLGTSAEVRVEAETDRSLGVDETQPLRPAARAAPQRPATLWVLAVGVEAFDNVPGLRPLPLATHDARDLGQTLAKQQGKAFATVRVTVLSEQDALKPTKANILAGLRDLERMRPEDTALVLLSSHGTSNAADYFVITKDIQDADLELLRRTQGTAERLAPGAAASALSGNELSAALRRLPGRRILVLDTCHAGAAGTSNPYSLIKRSASAQVAVVSASRGDESSYDSPDRPNSIFTGALVDVLGARSQAGPLTLRTAFDAALPQVQAQVAQYRRRSGEPVRQTPVLLAPPVLERSVLAIR